MMWLVEFDVPTEVLPPCGEDSDACTKQVVWALLSRVMVTGWVKIYLLVILKLKFIL